MPIIGSKVVFYQNMAEVPEIIHLHTFSTSWNSVAQVKSVRPYGSMHCRRMYGKGMKISIKHVTEW